MYTNRKGGKKNSKGDLANLSRIRKISSIEIQWILHTLSSARDKCDYRGAFGIDSAM